MASVTLSIGAAGKPLVGTNVLDTRTSRGTASCAWRVVAASRTSRTEAARVRRIADPGDGDDTRVHASRRSAQFVAATRSVQLFTQSTRLLSGWRLRVDNT